MRLSQAGELLTTLPRRGGVNKHNTLGRMLKAKMQVSSSRTRARSSCCHEWAPAKQWRPPAIMASKTLWRSRKA